MVYPVPGNSDGPHMHGRVLLFPVILVIAGFLLFSGLVIWYTTWAVSVSEHKWCAVVSTLNDAPTPPRASTKAELAFDASLAYEFRTLKSQLGC